MSQKLSHIKSFWVALVAARGVGGCLPADTRPPPAALTVTVTPDAALEMGIAESSTIDGWNIKFERFLLSLGYASFGGDDSFSPADSCDSYAGANYFMRTKATDAYAQDSGITLFVAGTAAKNGISKHFAWAFRRPLAYDDCITVRGLQEGVPATVNIAIRSAAMFQNDLDDTKAKLRFDPIAGADDQHGNADGEITLDELGNVPLGTLGGASGGMGVDTSSWQTLRDYLYLGLVPTIPRFQDTGPCPYHVLSRSERTPGAF